MQISNTETDKVIRRAASRKIRAGKRPTTVVELAAEHGVDMAEVRRHTERLMMAEEDPARERRLRELTQRIAEGRYEVAGDQVVDMAERRAIADRAAEL